MIHSKKSDESRICLRTAGILTGLFLAALIGPAACGADPAEPPPPTLSQALAQAELPKDGVFLAVGADKVKLPSDAVLPAPGSEVSAMTNAYGQIQLAAGAVRAITPPTMTVVYAPPETPNPYDGMPPGQVLKLLAATFSAAQWKAFLGPVGVGYAEMTEGPQRQLFEALFPNGHLIVIEDNPTGPNDPKMTRDLTGDALTQAHLHLGAAVGLALQLTGKPDAHVFAMTGAPAGAPKLYLMTNVQSSSVDHEFGALVRQTLPSAPKPGNLPFDAAVLKFSVPLGGLKTVNDLIARISTITRLEIYADPRYGIRTVTLIGPAQSAPAGDLLQALALCVAGTYRQVGPAFVLTDDLIGFGTRHALWKQFEDKEPTMLPGGGDILSYALPPGLPYTVQDIPWDLNSLAFTPAQQKQYWAKWRTHPWQSSYPMLELTLPFDQLSPAQQEVAEQTQQDNEKKHLDTTLDGTVQIQSSPVLEITLPALDGTVWVAQSYESLLPYPSLTPAEEKGNQKRMAADDPLIAQEDMPAPIGPLRPVLRKFERRAVRIAPKTFPEVKRALAACKTLGFNELWLQITPGSAQADAVALSLLTQAAADGKAAGISILPDLRLLRWDPVPPTLADRDIQGRTPLQASSEGKYRIFDAHDTVTPFAPETLAHLTSLARQIGAISGIGGMVWDETTTTGYEAVSHEDFQPAASLGYTEAGRLAFLRLAHADPVDLYPNGFTDERADVSLPSFDDLHQTRALHTQWCVLRSKAAQNLARRLAASLPATFRLIVPPSNSAYSHLYGSWDDLRKPPPEVRYTARRGPDDEFMMGMTRIETMPSTLCYRNLEFFSVSDASAQGWAGGAARAIRAAAPQTDRNIVLDVTDKPELLDALADKERSLFPAPTAPKSRVGAGNF